MVEIRSMALALFRLSVARELVATKKLDQATDYPRDLVCCTYPSLQPLSARCVPDGSLLVVCW